jgi:sec-independent protein translocase protein TatB
MGTAPPIALGNIGIADSLILMVLALVVFGPRRLPQIGRQIGKLMYEFRKASNDFKFQMEEELRLSEEADRRKKEEEQRRQLAATQEAQASVSATPALAKSIETPAPIEAKSGEMQTSDTSNEADSTPRILPPSTGEIVASARRSELAELTEPPADTASHPAPDRSANGSGPVSDLATTGATKAENDAMEAASRNG